MKISAPPAQSSATSVSSPVFSNVNILSRIMQFASQSTEDFQRLGTTNTHMADVVDIHGGAIYRQLFNEDNIIKAANEGDMRTLANFVEIYNNMTEDKQEILHTFVYAVFKLAEIDRAKESFWILDHIRPPLNLSTSRGNGGMGLIHLVAENGDLGAMKELHRRGYDLTLKAIRAGGAEWDAIEFALLGGYMNVVLFLHSLGIKTGVDIINKLCISGRVKELRWLFETYEDEIDFSALTRHIHFALAHNHTEIADLLLEYEVPLPDRETLAYIIRDVTDPAVLEWIFAHGYEKRGESTLMIRWANRLAEDLSEDKIRQILRVFIAHEFNINEGEIDVIDDEDDGDIKGGVLLSAIEHEVPQLMKVAFELGARPYDPDYTANRLVMRRNIELLKIFYIHTQPYRNHKQIMQRCLVQSVSSCFEEGIRFLVGQGVDIDALGRVLIETDGEETEPYSYYKEITSYPLAAARGNLYYVELLLELGASLNVYYSIPNYISTNIGQPNSDLLALLIRHGLDPNRLGPGRNPTSFFASLYSTYIPLKIIELLYNAGGNLHLFPQEKLEHILNNIKFLKYFLEHPTRPLNPNEVFQINGQPRNLLSFMESQSNWDFVIKYGAKPTKEESRQQLGI